MSWIKSITLALSLGLLLVPSAKAQCGPGGCRVRSSPGFTTVYESVPATTVYESVPATTVYESAPAVTVYESSSVIAPVYGRSRFSAAYGSYSVRHGYGYGSGFGFPRYGAVYSDPYSASGFSSAPYFTGRHYTALDGATYQLHYDPAIGRYFYYPR